jgi:SAM-dependent methyltransferase
VEATPASKQDCNRAGSDVGSALTETRTTPYSYEALPLIGKLSLMLSHRLVLANLVPGTWLDLLCGHRAILQRENAADARIRGFYALDVTLDPSLADRRFHLTESLVDRTLPYRDGVFDNVTLINGLEHLWFPQDVLGECNRILRPGGVLQVIVPTWFGKPFLEFLAFRIGNPQACIEMDDHKLYYDERTLWPMLVRAGFVPRHIHMRRVKLFCSLYAIAKKSEIGVAV